MPVLSCGGMRYQFKWDDVEWKEVPRENQANVEATIHRALELGINHIETARGYGSSEMQLGAILPGLPRDRMIVQTKVAPTADPDEFLRTFDKSMSYLKLDYVDLLALHGVNNDGLLDFSLRKNGCLAAAQKLKRDGRARFIGFSTHAPTRIILTAVETGEFDYVNLHWYFVNEANWPAVVAARRHDMGVFIISPSDKGGLMYQPSKKLVELCRPLSPIRFNDLYCLARPEVHTLSVGAARPSDFDEHVGALDSYDDSESVIRPVEARLRAEMRRQLGDEWCVRWAEGLPEFQHLPGEVNVQEILRLWSLAKALDMIDYGRMRYNLLGNGGHWFPGRNAGSFSPERIVGALSASPFAERIPAILAETHEMLADAPKKRLSQSGS